MYKLGDTGAVSGALHRRIAAELRRQIEAGELRSGELLPSENTLMGRFGASRGTVRQALAALRADGTIAGSRGRPPAVRGARLTQPLDELVSFSAWARSLGKRPGGAVDSFASGPAGADECAALDLPPGSTVYRLVRVRLADDEPLMVERTTFPQAIGELLAAIDLNQHSIYAELAGRGIVAASARHLISTVPASRADARLLGVSPRAPLLQVFRHAFAADGRPLEWSDDRYIAGRVNFAVENTAHTPGVARRLGQNGGR